MITIDYYAQRSDVLPFSYLYADRLTDVYRHLEALEGVPPDGTHPRLIEAWIMRRGRRVIVGRWIYSRREYVREELADA